MLKEAQEANSFYATKETFECKVGPSILGMIEPDPIFKSGLVGVKLGVFEDARANKRIYQQIPVLERNSVNYVAFASIDRLSFEPDVLIVTANTSQAEIILRAISYTSGSMWHVKGTTVIGCAWLFLYPYLSGDLNMTITGFSHGMKARRLFPEGLVLISIPYNMLSLFVQNLQNMEWDLPQYHRGKEAHLKYMEKIAQEIRKELEEK